jgi:hypothetical protein
MDSSSISVALTRTSLEQIQIHGIVHFDEKMMRGIGGWLIRMTVDTNHHLHPLHHLHDHHKKALNESLTSLISPPLIEKS